MNEAKNGVNPSVKQERKEKAAERRRTWDTVEFQNIKKKRRIKRDGVIIPNEHIKLLLY